MVELGAQYGDVHALKATLDPNDAMIRPIFKKDLEKLGGKLVDLFKIFVPKASKRLYRSISYEITYSPGEKGFVDAILTVKQTAQNANFFPYRKSLASGAPAHSPPFKPLRWWVEYKFNEGKLTQPAALRGARTYPRRTVEREAASLPIKRNKKLDAITRRIILHISKKGTKASTYPQILFPHYLKAVNETAGILGADVQAAIHDGYVHAQLKRR